MRNFIFLGILLSMAGLAAFHVWTGSWTALTIDAGVAFMAWRAWNPGRARRR